MGQSHSVGSGHIPPHGRSGISHRNRWPDPRHSYRYIPAYADRGTPYRVRQQELNDLEDPNGRRQFGGPYLSMNEAARMMEEIGASALTPAQHAAVDRLQALEQVGSYGGDIIFKTFNDLDLVFFRGSLRGNVNLAWTDIGPHDRDRSAGVTRDSRPPQRVRIELNEFVLKIPRAGLRDVWATLLHEMVHAYLMVVCGPRMESDDAPRPGQRPVPRHGQYFSRSLKAVRHRLGSKDGVKLALEHDFHSRNRRMVQFGYRRGGRGNAGMQSGRDQRRPPRGGGGEGRSPNGADSQPHGGGGRGGRGGPSRPGRHGRDRPDGRGHGRGDRHGSRGLDGFGVPPGMSRRRHGGDGEDGPLPGVPGPLDDDDNGFGGPLDMAGPWDDDEYDDDFDLD